jgi:hypothetical protein
VVTAIFIHTREHGALECLVDTEDLDLIADSNIRFTAIWSQDASTFYVGGYLPGLSKDDRNGKYILMHRLVTKASSHAHVDHKHHNGLDNRKSELSVTTRRGNQLNRRATTRSKSGIRGVRQRPSGKWEARIKIFEKQSNLGLFGTAEEAKAAVNAALIENGYDFAVTQ